MRKRQISGYEAGKRVQALWVEHATDLDSIEDMPDEKILLDKTLDKIETAAAIQSEDIKGEATLKEELKEAMAKTIVIYSLRGRVKANQANNAPLAQALSHPITYYSQADAELAFARATATKDKIKSNLTILTNITPENVIEMEKAINDFKEVITAPESSKENQKVTGTDEIEILTNELDQIIMNIGDLIHSYFPDSVLSRQFDAQSKIGSTVTRHNHVIFHIETADTHLPIETATATKVLTNQTITADQDGMIEFGTVRAGKQEFTIQAEGYKTKTAFVIVTRGTTTELVIQLDTL